MCGSMVDIQSAATEIRRGKNEKEMWANAQRDGRPAEYRWRPSVQRRKVWLTPTTSIDAIVAVAKQKQTKWCLKSKILF